MGSKQRIGEAPLLRFVGTLLWPVLTTWGLFMSMSKRAVSHDDKQEPHDFSVGIALKLTQAKEHQGPSKYPVSSCSLDWYPSMKHAHAGCQHRLT